MSYNSSLAFYICQHFCLMAAGGSPVSGCYGILRQNVTAETDARMALTAKAGHLDFVFSIHLFGLFFA